MPHRSPGGLASLAPGRRAGQGRAGQGRAGQESGLHGGGEHGKMLPDIWGLFLGGFLEGLAMFGQYDSDFQDAKDAISAKHGTWQPLKKGSIYKVAAMFIIVIGCIWLYDRYNAQVAINQWRKVDEWDKRKRDEWQRQWNAEQNDHRSDAQKMVDHWERNK